MKTSKLLLLSCSVLLVTGVAGAVTITPNSVRDDGKLIPAAKGATLAAPNVTPQKAADDYFQGSQVQLQRTLSIEAIQN